MYGIGGLVDRSLQNDRSIKKPTLVFVVAFGDGNDVCNDRNRGIAHVGFGRGGTV
jgi:hypothetical protein